MCGGLYHIPQRSLHTWRSRQHPTHTTSRVSPRSVTSLYCSTERGRVHPVYPSAGPAQKTVTCAIAYTIIGVSHTHTHTLSWLCCLHGQRSFVYSAMSSSTELLSQHQAPLMPSTVRWGGSFHELHAFPDRMALLSSHLATRAATTHRLASMW